MDSLGNRQSLAEVAVEQVDVAERLGTDSPAFHGNTMTLDALTARANTGSVDVGADTTIILDEAGMVDHKRLDALTDLVERSGAKLIAVGDGKQLPSIGPGGMFDRLAGHTPTVELDTIHRTTDRHEQQAWQVGSWHEHRTPTPPLICPTPRALSCWLSTTRGVSWALVGAEQRTSLCFLPACGDRVLVPVGRAG